MPHRDGGKFGGNHTTFIELAADLVDIAATRPEVNTISAGIIHGGQGVAGGGRRVKFVNTKGGILLKVRQSRSVQEVWLITTDPQATMFALARATLNNLNACISFQKPS